jgi:hypothetical protein
MGTTIRRQPVSFDIPKSPDYKFLNITNFRGLDVSSNPFESASNTASDCLNVYVDETNTLTTRPRLDLYAASPIDGEHIGTYNLHDGYLLHYNQYVRDEITNQISDKKPIMWLFKDGKLNDKQVQGDIPSMGCVYFEQGNKIYLLDGSRYMVIDDNRLDDVTGYIPTKSIVTLDGTRVEADSLNLLTDLYYEKYYWDGISEKPELNSNTINVDNNYYSEVSFENTFVPLQCYSDYSAFGYYNGQSNLVYAEFDPKKEIKYTDTGYARTDNMVFMTDEKGFWRFSGTTLIRAMYSNGEFNEQTYTASATITNCQTSPNGFNAIIVSGGAWYNISIGTDSVLYGTSIVAPAPSGSTSKLGIYGISNTNVYWLGKDTDYLYVYVARLEKTLTFGEFDKFGYFAPGQVLVTPNSSLVVITSNRTYTDVPVKFIVYENNNVKTKTEHNILLPGGTPRLSVDGIIYGGAYTTKNPARTWYFPTHTDLSKYVILDVGDHYFNPEKYNGSLTTKYSAYIFKNKYVAIYNQYSSEIKSKYFIFNNTTEPLLQYTQRLSYTDEELYNDWDDKRNKLFKSKLYARFDNNYWLSSGNRYYRSANNDPTYFPLTEYNDLGDSNEEITGFNLANDSALLVYKRNKLYLIQPFTTSQDSIEYTVTESKNTVGNTAIGAPIVTTLSEIPLQINNDGVYGLSQLSNVSSTERIADLLSEGINERWLRIDDSIINNVKTLNRLYWTYLVLAEPSANKTMIYLLDNRSNSWYYWEIPIVVENAFVKNNTTQFVDVRGDIYYLTSTDILDTNYDEEKITKYYDYGEKLITWYWQSQILPMGTMNYSKRLVNTTFILTDTDDSDGYGLQYNFKVFRKLASSTPEKEISDKLTLVRSTTKKTNISKFGFIQMRISNLTTDSRGYEAYENNKLRLVGLGLKYVLLEGLMR